ncbi:MAG TPA: response regulator transcription factor, partial [Aggregatilineales bacterium]|nr:response regulator transcription factor [Aggregatilineales bacterium]
MSKILLVEDSAELAQWIARELAAARYEVSVADNGLMAIEQHAREHPDLVILDWGLPDVDGLEVLRRMRQLSPTPVLMLTGRDQEIDRVVGLEVGADDYLIKPFSMRELLARTHAMLRRVELIAQLVKTEQAGESHALHYQALSLDAVTHTVSLHGEKLDLSRTEFDLLQLFMRHPGQVFDRADLLDRIWDADYSGQDR